MQYECSAFIIDTWVESVAQGRSNIGPQKLPWHMIRTLITETYGGKIDDEGDFRQLTRLVEQIMVAEAFETEHRLVEVEGSDEATLLVPSGTKMSDFLGWVKALPEREPPTYLGLPANAEKLLLVGHGRDMIRDLHLVTDLLDEGEQIMAEAVEG